MFCIRNWPVRFFLYWRILPLCLLALTDDILPRGYILLFFPNDRTISQASLCGICGWWSDSRIYFRWSILVLPCQYQSMLTFVWLWQILAIGSIAEEVLSFPMEPFLIANFSYDQLCCTVDYILWRQVLNKELVLYMKKRGAGVAQLAEAKTQRCGMDSWSHDPLCGFIANGSWPVVLYWLHAPDGKERKQLQTFGKYLRVCDSMPFVPTKPSSQQNRSSLPSYHSGCRSWRGPIKHYDHVTVATPKCCELCVGTVSFEGF